MAARRIAVIGAGPTGLAAAHDLGRAGHRVTLVEAAPQVGGLGAGFTTPGWEWSLERYYHHLFASDSHALALVEELGWRDRVLFSRPYTVVWFEDQFHPLDSKTHALSFCLRHFSLLDTLRFGLVGLYLRLNPRWRSLERVTVEDWMRRWAGARVYESLWQPLLVSKFGEQWSTEVNMAWLWARLHARTTRLGTFAGGFQTFLDHLADVVRAQGGEIRLGCPAEGIVPEPGQDTLGLHTPSGRDTFDAAVFTGSPESLVRLAPSLPASYADRLRSLRSLGVVTLILALRHRLTRFYWHNLPKAAGFPFLALIEHTNFVPPERYGGDHIVYCGDYLHPEHELFSADTQEILDRFLPGLKRFNPDFEPDWVRESWLFRARYAQPVPTVGHSSLVPPLRTPIPGLYLACMSQVYPWDRGTNFAVELGRRVAGLVTEDLTTGPRVWDSR